MEDLFIYIIAGVVLGSVLFILLQVTKTTHKKIDATQLSKVFDKDNVESLELVRNKVVMTFKDINQVQFEDLKKYGAQGISIVGNKIKFYVSSKKEENEKAFKALKEYVER